jgi:two-component system cell cycle sensor histidine kinase/response regulator CckA
MVSRQVSGYLNKRRLRAVFAGNRGGRKELEDKLLLTQFTVDHAPDFVQWLDADGRILEVNQSSTARYGYSRKEMLGLRVFDLDPTLSAALWLDQRREIRRRGSVVMETLHQTKQGEVFPVEVASNRVLYRGREYYVTFVRDIGGRKEAEEALKTTQVQLETAMDLADLVNWEFDVNTGLFTFNDRFYALYGTTAAREGGYQMPAGVYARRFVHPDDQNLVGEEIKKAIKTTDPDYHAYVEHRMVRPDGEIRHIAVRYGITKDQEGRTTKTHGANQDITERTQTAEALALAQDQLRQAQKMEAVGQLAGGIAHDFNNLLTAIMGYADLVLAPGRLVDDSCRPDLEEIRSAAERASTLTHQILAFSRRQTLRPTVVSLNEVVAGTERLLRRTLGEDLELATVLGPDLGLVEVDVPQFETVLVNLSLNARDAMSEGGGRLTIETANVELGQECAETHPMVKPGSYVMVAVSDTGTGMDEETSAHAFEPFFTTKEPGRGTGLGLSTVYGIVKQSGGNVFLYTEPGRGTTFKIYLPRVDKVSAKRKRAAARRLSPQRGREAILVVEDEEAVRTLAARVLSELGYEVMVASSGREALSLLAARTGPVDLLLTDILLPGEVRGDQLAREAKAAHRDLMVLFMSGYTRDSVVYGGRVDECVDYLEKPFTPARLGQYVREILDRGTRAG